jgi:hypothetical protein
VAFTLDRETWERKATVVVTNPGDEKVVVQVKAPTRVNLSVANLELPPSGQGEIDLTIPSLDVEPLDAKLVINDAFHRIELPLRAKATPARVAVTHPSRGKVLQFDGKFGEVLTAEVKLENTGGATAFISALANPPFTVVEGTDGRELGANEELSYRIELRPDRIGPLQEVLKIQGADRQIEIPLVASITLPPGMEPPPPAEPRPRDVGAIPNKVYRAPGMIPLQSIVVGESDVARKQSRSIPYVRKVSVKDVGRDTLTFAWKHPAGEPWGYLVETEVHRFDDESGLPYPYWLELGPDYAKVSTDGEGGRATITGLKPSSKYTFRLISKDGDVFSNPGPRLTFITEAKPSLFGWLKLWMVGVAAALVAGGILFWRKIQYDREIYS